MRACVWVCVGSSDFSKTLHRIENRLRKNKWECERQEKSPNRKIEKE